MKKLLFLFSLMLSAHCSFGMEDVQTEKNYLPQGDFYLENKTDSDISYFFVSYTVGNIDENKNIIGGGWLSGNTKILPDETLVIKSPLQVSNFDKNYSVWGNDTFFILAYLNKAKVFTLKKPGEYNIIVQGEELSLIENVSE